MFKNLEDISKFCNDNGYCVVSENHHRTLVKKTSANSYNAFADVVVNGIGMSGLEYFIGQLNNNVVNPAIGYDEIRTCLQVIRLDVFRQYDNRQADINHYKKILDQLDNSKFKLFGKSNNLVTGTKYMRNDETGRNGYVEAYFNIIDKELVYIDERQLSDRDKKKALEFKRLDVVEMALQDNLINQYTEKYNEECRKWDSLK